MFNMKFKAKSTTAWGELLALFLKWPDPRLRRPTPARRLAACLGAITGATDDPHDGFLDGPEPPTSLRRLAKLRRLIRDLPGITMAGALLSSESPCHSKRGRQRNKSHDTSRRGLSRATLLAKSASSARKPKEGTSTPCHSTMPFSPQGFF